MADDQRPYRSSDAIARDAQTRNAAGSDPLAELARLIGQSDPFGEYAREHGRQPAAQPQPAPAVNWAPQQQQTSTYSPQTVPAAPHEPEPQAYPATGYGQQAFESYPAESQVPAYLSQRGDAAGQGAYDHAAYDPNNPPYSAEHTDFYDDVPPSRRRMGILVIAGIFALAVLGTAGALGYRAIFGSSSSGGQPPVIKAETAPSKIVPASTAKDAASNKLITDRVGGAGGEKIVSREEQPVEGRDKPAGVIFPQQDNPPSSTTAAPMGSGVVGAEPKKIRTIAIHPDGSAVTADATPSAPPPPPRTASVPQPAPAPAPVRPSPAAAAPSGNAPLSLNPNAQAPAPRAAAPAPAPTRTANAPTSLAPAAPAATTGSASGTFVQVSSQRSEAEAQAAFRALQGKYPDQLGSRQPAIHRVDLGAKGIYFRAMVGPLAGAEATELCSNLKAAGGSCIIQRN